MAKERGNEGGGISPMPGENQAGDVAAAPVGSVFPPATGATAGVAGTLAATAAIAATPSPQSIDEIEVDPNDVGNFVEQIKGPLVDSLLDIARGVSPAAIARYADAVLPEIARLQILMRNPDVRIASVAERRYRNLKIQTMNDTARYGITVEQRAELAFLSALDTAVAFGRRWLLGQVPQSQPAQPQQ